MTLNGLNIFNFLWRQQVC